MRRRETGSQRYCTTHLYISRNQARLSGPTATPGGARNPAIGIRQIVLSRHSSRMVCPHSHLVAVTEVEDSQLISRALALSTLPVAVNGAMNALIPSVN